jgi:hypothetical protein
MASAEGDKKPGRWTCCVLKNETWLVYPLGPEVFSTGRFGCHDMLYLG